MKKQQRLCRNSMLAAARPTLFTTSELAARPTDCRRGDPIIVAVSDRPAESRLLAAKQPRRLGYFFSANCAPESLVDGRDEIAN